MVDLGRESNPRTRQWGNFLIFLSITTGIFSFSHHHTRIQQLENMHANALLLQGRRSGFKSGGGGRGTNLYTHISYHIL